MNKPLTLTEARKLLDDLSTEEAMNDKRIQEFLSQVERAGKSLLQERGGGKYVKDATEFLSAACVAEMIGGGEIVKAIEFLSDKEMSKIVAIIFIYSVGLGIVEELH